MINLDEYKGKYVLLSTDENKRGVFFGVLEQYDNDKKQAVLSDCRMIVKWSSETKGFNSIAHHGVKSDSRVTFAAPSHFLDGVSSIALATDEAIKSVTASPWS